MEIYEGMTVRSPDGEKLGKIGTIGEGTFTIEKGLFGKERHELRFSDVLDVRDGDAIVAGYEQAAAPAETAAATSETRIPLAEEQLDVQKRSREAGEVQVTKTVEVEERQVTVPVRKERVHVERAPASAQAGAAEADFTEQTIRVPLREEEVEVTKRPVVREEVRLTKDVVEEARDIREPLRHERAEIRTEGDVEGPTRRDPDRG